jgi:hypothetical protein
MVTQPSRLGSQNSHWRAVAVWCLQASWGAVPGSNCVFSTQATPTQATPTLVHNTHLIITVLIMWHRQALSRFTVGFLRCNGACSNRPSKTNEAAHGCAPSVLNDSAGQSFDRRTVAEPKRLQAPGTHRPSGLMQHARHRGRIKCSRRAALACSHESPPATLHTWAAGQHSHCNPFRARARRVTSRCCGRRAWLRQLRRPGRCWCGCLRPLPRNEHAPALLGHRAQARGGSCCSRSWRRLAVALCAAGVRASSGAGLSCRGAAPGTPLGGMM